MKTSIREFPELVDETLVPLSKMSEHYPVEISRPSAERAWRHGCRGVRLETVYLNGKRYTSVEAISRYVTRTQRTGDESSAVLAPSMSNCHIVAARKKHNLPPAGKDGVAYEEQQTNE